MLNRVGLTVTDVVLDIGCGCGGQFGLMFFDDPVAAFTNLRRALARGAWTLVC